VFVSERGAPFLAPGFSRMVARAAVSARLGIEAHPHMLRHADDGSIVGVELDKLDNDDKYMRHLAQIVRNGLGDRAGTCIDPKMQDVDGKRVCVVSCQRSRAGFS
jgi:hypothetical protein